MIPWMAEIEIAELSKHFQGLAVLNGITLNVDAGEIVGLIGPNGAGETTLFNVITGIYTPNSGLIHSRGKNLVGLKPHQICKIGITRTFQLVRIFASANTVKHGEGKKASENQENQKGFRQWRCHRQISLGR